MKQAILITAYKNVNQLQEIVSFFDDVNFVVFIHFDKKSDAEISEIKGKNIQLISRKFKVNWGGINHLKAILQLTEEALKHQDIGFFHLISGQDFPVKSIEYFKSQLDTTKEYLEYFKLPTDQWNMGGLNRLEFYNFYDVFDSKKHPKIISRIVSLQIRLGFKRKIDAKMPPLYGGSTWWSLSRYAAKYVIEYTEKNKFFLNRFKHSFCSEEMYFQTILLNSEFAKTTINDNLRYIDWESDSVEKPAILDESYFEKIKNSNTLFARKLDFPKSQKLKNLLKTENNK